VFLLKASGKFADSSFKKMQDIVVETTENIKLSGSKCYAIIPSDNEPNEITFDNTIKCREKLCNVNLKRQDTPKHSLSKYLEKALDLFRELEDQEPYMYMQKVK
jgi:hypothetical protein